MDKASLQAAIDACHARGQKVAVCFCAHVPAEILEAAGFCVLRLFHLDDVEDISSRALPRNLCPIVKECYSLLEDPVLQEADLIITESSCDGKQKMYELISCRDKTYYYQVPQGAERDYVRQGAACGREGRRPESTWQQPDGRERERRGRGAGEGRGVHG